MFVCMCVCVYICIYMCVCIHIYIRVNRFINMCFRCLSPLTLPHVASTSPASTSSCSTACPETPSRTSTARAAPVSLQHAVYIDIDLY